ncbi:B3 domain-containing transcription factor VRN1 [Spinacia oleracea]|uniref:B3 domain-containing transcription factor VRN1 n=1 Tax=Spinacia oleracea TaxID=3562 RepID=A0A9R0JQ71_SPIOL|nr:B3 domain-containing transcription factor VRN1-like [Spinacia oleracea]
MARSSRFDGPKFFKVFLPEHYARQLHICSNFKSNLNSSNVTREATITRPGTTQQWKVELLEKNTEFYFQKGWNKFVKDNNMKIGEFMVFTYNGNSNFSVKLYGTHCCLKEDVEEGEEIDDVTLINDDVKVNRPKLGRRPKWVLESEVVKAAEAYRMTHPEIPSFLVGISICYTSNMCIPSKWVSAHLNITTDECSITLTIPRSEKAWCVKMITHPRYRDRGGLRWRLSRGLDKFFLDNNIQIGDVCVFKLVEDRHYTFKVIIFHKSHYN